MAVDPFLLDYDADELAVAAEFLANWLPFLTRGLSDGCSAALHRRVQSINPGGSVETLNGWDPDSEPDSDRLWHSVSVPVVTGWDAPAEVTHAPLPTGWDAPPEVALQLVLVESERPQTPPPAIPKTTRWVVDSDDLHLTLEEGSAESGWEAGNAKEEVNLSWADMVEDEEMGELRSRSRSPTWESVGVGSAGRWFERRTCDRGLLGSGPGQVNPDMLVGGSPRPRIQGMRSARTDGSGEQRGWRGQLEQKRTMLSSNRNVQLGEESYQGYCGRRPMLEQQQTVSRRDGSMLEQQRTVSRKDEPQQQQNEAKWGEPMLEQQQTVST